MLCLEPAFLRDQILRSRRNLRLETLDLWLIEQPELALQSLRRARSSSTSCAAPSRRWKRRSRDGQIAAYGVCTWDGLLRSHTDRAHLSLLDLFDWALDVGGADHHLRAIQLPYNLAMAEALRLPSQIGPAGGTAAVLSALHGTGTLVLASAPLMQGRALGRLPEFVRECLRAAAQRRTALPPVRAQQPRDHVGHRGHARGRAHRAESRAGAPAGRDPGSDRSDLRARRREGR